MKIIIYTATAGGRDSKVRPPHYRRKDDDGNVYRYVAYTDGRVDVDDGWIHRPVLANDIWAALELRCLPHRYFPKADWTIYHDNSVVLRKDEHGDPANLMQAVMHAQSRIAARLQCLPSGRDTLEQAIDREKELAALRHYNHDYLGDEQLAYYKRYPAVATSKRPVRGGLLIRKNCEQLNKMNEKWWEEVCRWNETTNQAGLTAALMITKLYNELWEIPREAALGKGHK